MPCALLNRELVNNNLVSKEAKLKSNKLQPFLASQRIQKKIAVDVTKVFSSSRALKESNGTSNMVPHLIHSQLSAHADNWPIILRYIQPQPVAIYQLILLLASHFAC